MIPLDYQVGAAGELLKWPQQFWPDQEIQLPSDIIEEAKCPKQVKKRMVAHGVTGFMDKINLNEKLMWESNSFPFCFLEESFVGRSQTFLRPCFVQPGEPRQAQAGWNSFIQLSSSRDAAGRGYSPKIQRLGPAAKPQTQKFKG